MAVYFLSDVHLRLDRPERGRRLARLVDGLDPGDRVVVVGDLCDFWFSSRQARRFVSGCEGLRSLRDFRSRGGSLDLLPGNHDAWLGPFYARHLGAGFAGSPSMDVEALGLRFRAVHGHRLGATSRWKAAMEGRAFLRAFSALPGPAAGLLNVALDAVNERKEPFVNRRHLDLYRGHADARAREVDVVVFGHIHIAHDDRETAPRLVVLGGWHHRTSYLRVDEGGARLIVVEDRDAGPPPGKPPSTTGIASA